MAQKPTPDDTEKLISGLYAVDAAHPLPGAGGGLPAFAVTDRRNNRGGLMAVQSLPEAPPRAQALNALSGWMDAGLLPPLAHGAARGAQGEVAWFVVSPAPPGPSLAATLRPCHEADLLHNVLRPAAAVLEALEARGITHRAICLDNLFRPGPGEPVVLGAAWSAPPASRQPALFEPPYSATCLPAGRGEGSIADDVYALGVVLVALALGRVPLEGMDPAAIMRRKLAVGSYAALVGEDRLPPAIGDLVRGMLAEDPEHRPLPMLLSDPINARARRVAARPMRRGQRPLELAGGPVWDARSLAVAVATDPEEGTRLLRSGAVVHWLRRSLGDPALAVRLEEVVRLRALDGTTDDARADGLLTMRAVAALDPLAPLNWRGVSLWPDGLGPALAAGAAEGAPAALLTERLGEMVGVEAVGHWAAMRAERADPTKPRTEARQHRTMLRMRGWGGGLPRLRYALNPLLPCRSKRLAGQMVARLSDLLPALEVAAARPEARSEQILDHEIAAFIAARHDQHIPAELVGLADSDQAEQVPLLQLRVLAGLQRRLEAGRLPGLAAWLAEQAAPALQAWRNRSHREALQQALAERVEAGQLGAMLAVLDNDMARAADARGFHAAGEVVNRIDARLAQLAAGGPDRANTARRLGHEIALGVAMMAMTIAGVAMVMS